MAADGKMRHRSRRIREGSARAMKPRGGIRSLLKSRCSSGKSGDRGIPAHAGTRGTVCHIVKPGIVESEVKPSSADPTEEVWIYVRGCRIKRSGLRFNSQGEVYVPDSEGEEEEPAGVDLAPAVAADGSVGVDLAPTVAADGASGVDLAPAVAADEVAIVEMKLVVAARLAKKVLGEDLHPEVAALLGEVLSKMEPVYHECFIDMYKIILVIRSF